MAGCAVISRTWTKGALRRRRIAGRLAHVICQDVPARTASGMRSTVGCRQRSCPPRASRPVSTLPAACLPRGRNDRPHSLPKKTRETSHTSSRRPRRRRAGARGGRSAPPLPTPHGCNKVPPPPTAAGTVPAEGEGRRSSGAYAGAFYGRNPVPGASDNVFRWLLWSRSAGFRTVRSSGSSAVPAPAVLSAVRAYGALPVCTMPLAAAHFCHERIPAPLRPATSLNCRTTCPHPRSPITLARSLRVSCSQPAR